jgi:hypothetical protein
MKFNYIMEITLPTGKDALCDFNKGEKIALATPIMRALRGYSAFTIKQINFITEKECVKSEHMGKEVWADITSRNDFTKETPREIRNERMEAFVDKYGSEFFFQSRFQGAGFPPKQITINLTLEGLPDEFPMEE